MQLGAGQILGLRTADFRLMPSYLCGAYEMLSHISCGVCGVKTVHLASLIFLIFILFTLLRYFGLDTRNCAAQLVVQNRETCLDALVWPVGTGCGGDLQRTSHMSSRIPQLRQHGGREM